MKSKIMGFLTRFWLLFFFVLLYGFASYFQLSFETIWHTALSLDIWQLALLLGIYFLFSFFTILNRKLLLFNLGHPCRFRNLLLIHFSSMAAHYSTPAKIGYPLAVFLLHQFEKVSYSKAMALILIELTVSITLSGIFAVIGNLLFFDFFPTFIIQASIIMLSFLFFIFIFLYIMNFCVSYYKTKRFFFIIINAFQGLSISKLFLYAGLVGLVQLFGVSNLFLLTSFFSDGISFPQAITVSSTAFFLGAVSMIPMGLGVREATVLFLLTRLGIPKIAGLSIVAVQRLLSTGLTFLLGALFGCLLGTKKIT